MSQKEIRKSPQKRYYTSLRKVAARRVRNNRGHISLLGRSARTPHPQKKKKKEGSLVVFTVFQIATHGRDDFQTEL